jgi:hypothetical protein
MVATGSLGAVRCGAEKRMGALLCRVFCHSDDATEADLASRSSERKRIETGAGGMCMVEIPPAPNADFLPCPHKVRTVVQ